MKKKTGKRYKATRVIPGFPDAVALLEADHGRVEEWFEQFESSRADSKRKTIATQICQALT